MKLYLSSYRMPSPREFAEIVGKKPEDTRLAFIPNAKDYYAQRAWDFKLGEAKAYFAGLGYQIEVVDLREFTDAQKLKGVLCWYDAIWANGGNTFCLRYEMRRSGFEEIIGDVLEGGVVYAGESAGAIAAGTSLEGAELADEPEFAEDVIWEGLHLVPKFILPHADNPAFAEASEPIARQRGKDDDFIALNDDQALVVDGGYSRVVAAA